MAKRFIRDKFLTFLYIWYYLFVPVILVNDLTFYLTWSIQLDCFLYSPAWYTWLCFEIKRRNWKLITFQTKQNYFYVLTSVHRKQECLSWRENFSLKWKFDLFLFFFVLFFCFVFFAYWTNQPLSKLSRSLSQWDNILCIFL